MKPRQIAGKNYTQRARGRSGGGGVAGPSIQLSAATIADNANIGDIIGALSVVGGIGSYTFSFNSGGNPGTKYSITGSSLKVAAALSAGSDAISIHADNGAGSTIDRAFLITVTPTVAPPDNGGLAMNMSDFANTYILGL